MLVWNFRFENSLGFDKRKLIIIKLNSWGTKGFVLKWSFWQQAWPNFCLSCFQFSIFLKVFSFLKFSFLFKVKKSFFYVGSPKEDIFFDHLLWSIFQSKGTHIFLQITILVGPLRVASMYCFNSSVLWLVGTPLHTSADFA